MGHRKVEDEREARALLAKLTRTGGDLVGCARAHGIDGRSLHAWKVILERRQARRSAPKPSLVELVPVSRAETLAAAKPKGRARYTLRVGDAELEFDDDARADTLRRVLEALRTC